MKTIFSKCKYSLNDKFLYFKTASHPNKIVPLMTPLIVHGFQLLRTGLVQFSIAENYELNMQ